MSAAAPTAKTSAFDARDIFIRFGFLIVIAACFAFFSFYNRNFLGLANLTNILEGSAILLVVSLGMTLVVAQGGIDLSVGVALDFGSAFAIVALKNFDVAWYTAVMTGIVGGMIVGLLNAFLVVRLSVSPFLATLGVYFIGGSVQRIFTHGGGPISFRRSARGILRHRASADFLGVPMKIVIGLAVVAVYYIVLERSLFGKRIHAIGLQRSAAQVAGIKAPTYLALASSPLRRPVRSAA